MVAKFPWSSVNVHRFRSFAPQQLRHLPWIVRRSLAGHSRSLFGQPMIDGRVATPRSQSDCVAPLWELVFGHLGCAFQWTKDVLCTVLISSRTVYSCSAGCNKAPRVKWFFDTGLGTKYVLYKQLTANAVLHIGTHPYHEVLVSANSGALRRTELAWNCWELFDKSQSPGEVLALREQRSSSASRSPQGLSTSLPLTLTQLVSLTSADDIVAQTAYYFRSFSGVCSRTGVR